MNIWEAYCNPAYYNVYFDTLVAKGISRKHVITLKEQYQIYLRRIKDTIFAGQLEQCSTPDTFREKLHEIFYVKWCGKVKYEEMPYHFEAYLSFLDSMQALHNDFINESEKKRLIDPNPEIPINCLTSYEMDYLKDGKLLALMNPQLLSILKEYIEEEKLDTKLAMLICEKFYGDLLPKMELEDYLSLINNLWNSSRNVKKGGKHQKFKIVFPDGHEEILSTTDGMKRVILFYGINEVKNRKAIVRGEPFIVTYIPVGKEKQYEEMLPNTFVCITGNTIDRLKVLKSINIGLGNKLKIEIVK